MHRTTTNIRVKCSLVYSQVYPVRILSPQSYILVLLVPSEHHLPANEVDCSYLQVVDCIFSGSLTLFRERGYPGVRAFITFHEDSPVDSRAKGIGGELVEVKKRC